jgi:hypothetical protein
MDIFIDLFNAILAFLNAILDLLERLLSPILNLIERWNKLFGGSE